MPYNLAVGAIRELSNVGRMLGENSELGCLEKVFSTREIHLLSPESSIILDLFQRTKRLWSEIPLCYSYNRTGHLGSCFKDQKLLIVVSTERTLFSTFFAALSSHQLQFEQTHPSHIRCFRDNFYKKTGYFLSTSRRGRRSDCSSPHVQIAREPDLYVNKREPFRGLNCVHIFIAVWTHSYSVWRSPMKKVSAAIVCTAKTHHYLMVCRDYKPLKTIYIFFILSNKMEFILNTKR